VGEENITSPNFIDISVMTCLVARCPTTELWAAGSTAPIILLVAEQLTPKASSLVGGASRCVQGLYIFSDFVPDNLGYVPGSYVRHGAICPKPALSRSFDLIASADG